MGIETLTDEKIAQLLACIKRVENPQARERLEGKHLRRDYRIAIPKILERSLARTTASVSTV